MYAQLAMQIRDYKVGKLAAVAIPHWLFLFLDILM